MLDIELWKRQKKILHITFDDLAEKSGVSISALKNIFRGTTTDPRIETVAAIEAALEITDGITQEERNAGKTATKAIGVSALEDKMLYAFKEIGYVFGEETQKSIVAMLENMLNTKK